MAQCPFHIEIPDPTCYDCQGTVSVSPVTVAQDPTDAYYDIMDAVAVRHGWVHDFYPSSDQIQQWEREFGPAIVRIGLREATEGFLHKNGGIGDEDMFFRFLKYTYVTIQNHAKAIKRRDRRREKRANQ